MNPTGSYNSIIIRLETPTAEAGALVSQTQHLKGLYAQYEQILLQCVDISGGDTHKLMVYQGLVCSHFMSVNLSALPKLEPPSFDGSVYGWEDFRDSGL